jgi:hypothetical protein
MRFLTNLLIFTPLRCKHSAPAPSTLLLARPFYFRAPRVMLAKAGIQKEKVKSAFYRHSSRDRSQEIDTRFR